MTRCSQAARLQDEVYRQIFRLEAGYAAADLRLAMALLRAWIVLEHTPSRSRARQWLRAVCPVCLHLIEAAPASPRDDNEELPSRRGRHA